MAGAGYARLPLADTGATGRGAADRRPAHGKGWRRGIPFALAQGEDSAREHDTHQGLHPGRADWAIKDHFGGAHGEPRRQHRNLRGQFLRQRRNALRRAEDACGAEAIARQRQASTGIVECLLRHAHELAAGSGAGGRRGVRPRHDLTEGCAVPGGAAIQRGADSSPLRRTRAAGWRKRWAGGVGERRAGDAGVDAVRPYAGPGTGRTGDTVQTPRRKRRVLR